MWSSLVLCLLEVLERPIIMIIWFHRQLIDTSWPSVGSVLNGVRANKQVYDKFSIQNFRFLYHSIHTLPECQCITGT